MRVTHNVDGIEAVQTEKYPGKNILMRLLWSKSFIDFSQSPLGKVCRILTAHSVYAKYRKRISHMRFAYACIMRINRFTFDPHLLAPIECSQTRGAYPPHSHWSASILIAHALPSHAICVPLKRFALAIKVAFHHRIPTGFAVDLQHTSIGPRIVSMLCTWWMAENWHALICRKNLFISIRASVCTRPMRKGGGGANYFT